MKKDWILTFVKNHVVELIAIVVIALIYSFRNLILYDQVLSLDLSLVVQLVVIPVLYLSLFVWMTLTKRYAGSTFSRLFYESFIMYVIPLHVILFYLSTQEFNPIVLIFLGGYLLFSFSYFFLIRKKTQKVFKIAFWSIDALLQFFFLFVWMVIIGLQQITF